jgi:hypothetical protein
MGVNAALWAILLAGGDPQWVKEGPPDLRRPADPGLILGVRGRVTFMDGIVSDEPDDNELFFSDLFDPGYGVRAEAGLLWAVGPGWLIGPLLSAGWDRYDGNRETDIFGDSLKPDDLDTFSLLIGFRSLYVDPWGFRAEGYASIGAIRWEDVDATFVISGVTESGVPFFDAITRFAFEAGGRFGWQFGAASFDLGFGINVQGGPSRGDVSPLIDPEEMIGFYFDLGFSLGF